MKYLFWLWVFAFGSIEASHAIVPPRHGGSMPQAYLDIIAGDPAAMRIKHGWIAKVRRARVAREDFVASPEYQRAGGLVSAPMRVTGTFDLPVLLGAFNNRPAPYDSGDLDQTLFNGPSPTGTIAQYYDEVSYGLLDVGGFVADWVELRQQDSYYEGSSNGMTPNDARTGEFIKELLDANDASLDFGIFDNDGPDGVPNSGDDDGVVDLVVLVHSESGGECDTLSTNMWSHSWLYRGWPISGGVPYTTNDAAYGGGFIKVDDYTIQPAKNCADAIIEIGSFCHELGHAFGLPDLFDPQGRNSGAGHWDLMGLGCWNTPSTPAHPSAWVRAELGWVVPTVVTWQGAIETVPQIETDPVCYKLPFSSDRFQRLTECAITGSYSLRCGLDASDAATRNWPGGAGYGNDWRESVEREFEFDGSTPVWLAFDYRCDLEPDADVGQVCIEVDGVETIIGNLTGAVAGATNIDLTPYLTGGTPPESYRLRFCVVSDFAWSDEDGKHDTECGALVVDNLTVTGGGVNYATGFEASADGWHQNTGANPATEYWLVENRQPVGFDANLHGSGLLIWHVDDEVLRSALGNSGGNSGSTVHGLVLEEADGVGHLLQDPATTGNEGDDGDPWPGSALNTGFDASSTPNSDDNSAHPTNVVVSGIGASGSTMSAFLQAGDACPVAMSAEPDVIENDLTAVGIEIGGSGFRYGARFWFEMSGEPDLVPASVYWRDDQTVLGEIYVYSREGGSWDLIVENPDGQRSTVEDALTIVELVAAQLVAAMINVADGDVELLFELFDKSEDERLVVSRADSENGPWIEMTHPPQSLDERRYRFVDGTAEPGRTYYYRLDVRSPGGDVRELYRGSAVIPGIRFSLEQNHPNPFNPTTSIRFHLPERANVMLEVFDITGARVAVVFRGPLPAGTHERAWNGRTADGSPLGSGVYIYRLTAGTRVESRKMILLK